MVFFFLPISAEDYDPLQLKAEEEEMMLRMKQIAQRKAKNNAKNRAEEEMGEMDKHSKGNN